MSQPKSGKVIGTVDFNIEAPGVDQFKEYQIVDAAGERVGATAKFQIVTAVPRPLI